MEKFSIYLLLKYLAWLKHALVCMQVEVLSAKAGWLDWRLSHLKGM